MAWIGYRWLRIESNSSYCKHGEKIFGRHLLTIRKTIGFTRKRYCSMGPLEKRKN
jgi:hypothetical protein